MDSLVFCKWYNITWFPSGSLSFLCIMWKKWWHTYRILQKKRHQFFKNGECTVKWGSSWSTIIRTSNKLKMKSLESSHPHLPTKLWVVLVLKALMLCCYSTNSSVVPFPYTPKSVKSSMQMESFQLEFMLSCPFFSTKKLYFFIVELFKRLHSLLVLTKRI